jgi:hypothetical protein
LIFYLDKGTAPRLENLVFKKEESIVWKKILSSAVKAKREGDFSRDLKDKDMKAVIEAAQKVAWCGSSSRVFAALL